MKKTSFAIAVFFLNCLFAGSASAETIQKVSLIPDPNRLTTGRPFTVSVFYDAYDSDNPSIRLKSTGLGMRIFYNSSALVYTGYDYFASAPAEDPPSRQTDTDNRDGDISTDMFIQFSWIDFSDTASWPSLALPWDIVRLDFIGVSPGTATIGADIFSSGLDRGDAAGTSVEILAGTPGDYDCGGTLGLEDCIGVLRMLAGIPGSPEDCPLNADINGNRKTDLGDCSWILQSVAGLR